MCMICQVQPHTILLSSRHINELLYDETCSSTAYRLYLIHILVYTLLLYVLNTQELYSIKGHTRLYLFDVLIDSVISEEICEGEIALKIELSSPAFELLE